MFKVDEEHKVALGLFGWFITERKKGPDKGKINLKITGTLPLVGAVRILALWHRVSATSTLERIDELKRLVVELEFGGSDDAYARITLANIHFDWGQFQETYAVLKPVEQKLPTKVLKE